MLRRTNLRSGALLFLAVLAGGAFLVIPIVGWPAAVMLRGFILGLAGGVFGALLFAAGFALAREREGGRGPAAVDPNGPAPQSTAEAKYWLRKFLEEHRVAESGQDEQRAPPGTDGAQRAGPSAATEHLAAPRAAPYDEAS